jgi:bifunctional UDP-N-acetylglucosamine pyrophosphorylase / glucosamine-1-phosphate N-acetyltransferase
VILDTRSVDLSPALLPATDGVAAVVLAAGKGTRMRSSRHKVLHRLAGRSMVWHVLTALHGAGIPAAQTVVVIGDSAETVRAEIEAEFGAGTYSFALQQPQLGTGHAVLQARPYVSPRTQTVVVAYGDTPLLQSETVTALVAKHRTSNASATLVTGHLADPQDLGRIIRDGAGRFQAIVEYRDATSEERAIREVNSGFCAFDASWLWEQLPHIQPAKNGEIYLTSLATAAAVSGSAESLMLEVVAEMIGVNTRSQLAEAEAILRRRINERLMAAGVTLQDPGTTYVDTGVFVGPDTSIYANTHLAGKTVIGRECEIGPNAIIRESTIGDGCRVVASVVHGAVLEDEVTVGPFAHVRPGTRCGRAAEVGTGSEIKASTLGAGSRMHHFGYLGDATVGANVNIGAGTVTCNYDGVHKHETRIGEGAFIGSDSLLIAPVSVGANALTGAGSVVTRDVPEGGRVAGVPAKSIAEKR